MKREWLINLRTSKQLTQQQVASSSFIDRSYYSHIENGKRNPSLAIAQNIAAVLKFDPLLFFKDDQINNVSDTLDLDYLLKNMESGHILYLYSNFNRYINSSVAFSLMGVWKKCYCFIIDTRMNFSQIKNTLKKYLSKNELNKYIHHINLDALLNQSPENLNTTHLEGLFNQLESEDFIYLCCHVRRDYSNNCIFNVQNQLNYIGIMENKEKLVSLHAYDASLVSANTHIKLMRKIPYLMTDNEIVESPLYPSSTNTKIYPSLYMQEDN
ncbi:XRE family transcriptional regulator [Robertmurraya yapensis]|uniref:XRE family transcriptional regulator n=1 Tax=Bacillus yapensis TaxID=2492960 RepID=A0A431WLR8_9BACI|nr:helix-turn-helix transcriptional regulator [Bacillus yapensis]RTR36387.1 XRE family transcriptional regulator [Bacillus yapensis]TKT05891.1 helix-turn-helix domain-containing protein [Bacillus yapensis]